MKINPHLAFDGKCEEAFKFYEGALGGKITFSMTYGESPMGAKMSTDWKKKIIHMSMDVRGQVISGADAPPPHFQKMQGMTLTLDIEDPGEAERLFKKIAEGGAVGMPIQETFWARRFGMCTDRFGTPWMVNCGKPR